MDLTKQPPRAFAVDPAGVVAELLSAEARIQAMGVSPALSAAVDVLQDAGAMTEDRVALLVAAERNGDDPERFARHLLKLMRAVRTGGASGQGE